MVGGIGGGDDDGASDCIAPVQRALGALQHFDLPNVEELLVELVGIGLEHPVDQHGNRRLAVSRLRNAADGDEGVADVLRLDQRHVRHHRDEVAGALDPRGLNLLRREDVHRDRHVLVGLIALARRDDDLLEVAGWSRRRSLCRAWHCDERGHRCRQCGNPSLP